MKGNSSKLTLPDNSSSTTMASFDDLAFGPTPTRAITPQLFCPDCDEVAVQTTPDRKRCLICGCALVDRLRRSGAENQQQPPIPDVGPGRDLQSLLQQLASTLGGGLGVNDDARRPAAQDAVSRLGSFTADQASTIEAVMTVSGVKGEVIAIPANFGPCDSLPRVGIVVANPIHGASDFENHAAMTGKLVVMERGVCTFATKVLRAQAAGAVGVIIIQTFDVWPYTMTDSAGESSAIAIPAFMLSMKQGSRFLGYLRSIEQNAKPIAEIVVRKDARECVICQVDMSIGMTLTRMPCQHMFHTECLHQWLKIGNSCPICRVEIPAQHGNHIRPPSSMQDQGWGAWFS